MRRSFFLSKKQGTCFIFLPCRTDDSKLKKAKNPDACRSSTAFSGLSCVPYHLSRELFGMPPATGKVVFPFLPPTVAGEHHSGSWITSAKCIYPRGPWAAHAEPAPQHEPTQEMQVSATALLQMCAPERTKTVSLQHLFSEWNSRAE